MTLPASGPLAMTDIQTEFGGTNPIGLNEYYAGGGLVPAGTSGTYGVVPSSGALSIQNFYGTSQFVPIYIEDVFSTYLYTGNGATQTITNGIDLAGEGGLLWIKSRVDGQSHELADTVRGNTKWLRTNSTAAQRTSTSGDLTSFNSDGFSLGASITAGVNSSGNTYASWTFRKQPKFFDVVTWTGNGAATQTINHSLDAAPGCIMVKATSTTGDWIVYHRGLSTPNFNFLRLNTTISVLTTSSQMWDTTTTNFTVYQYYGMNDLNVTYVAYLFAHDAGGFGLNGTDNVISCGSFSMPTSGGDVTVNLGYEPQWVLVKDFKHSGGMWWLLDTMRGYSAQKTAGTLRNSTGGSMQAFFPNTANAESEYPYGGLTATGFKWPSNLNYGDGNTDYIYIAIRRGPMKVPTSGTEVFAPKVRTGTASDTTVGNFGFPIDLVTSLFRPYPEDVWFDRLRGATRQIKSTETSAESIQEASIYGFDVMDGYKVGIDNVTNMTNGNTTASGYVNYAFRRAPGFFDVVCYAGTGSATTVAHNLTVVPELMIMKVRSSAGADWAVYYGINTDYVTLNSVDATNASAGLWNNTSPTSSVFTVGNNSKVNTGGETYVAYLFATCPGVSKVGTYTGTGATQVINCGFTGGARFVLIKSTSTTGDWYVWDSARGIVAGNDPYLTLNTTAAEVISTDWVDTAASGFELSNAGGNLANSNGVSYIFLAIA